MGTNNLTTRNPGDVIDSEDVNQYKEAIDVAHVPRNISGVPTDLGGNLGTTLLRWFNSFLFKITVGNPVNEVTLEESSGELQVKVIGVTVARVNANGIEGQDIRDQTITGTQILRGNHTQVVNSGNYLVQTDFDKLFITAMGGGGGGGGGGGSATGATGYGGGGAGGTSAAREERVIEVIPGATMPVVIGAGGGGGNGGAAGNNAGAAGANGGDTTFGGLTFKGGKGGGGGGGSNGAVVGTQGAQGLHAAKGSFGGMGGLGGAAGFIDGGIGQGTSMTDNSTGGSSNGRGGGGGGGGSSVHGQGGNGPIGAPAPSTAGGNGGDAGGTAYGAAGGGGSGAISLAVPTRAGGDGGDGQKGILLITPITG